MITALVGLAWIWWALCGLGATFMGFWAFGSLIYQPDEINIKHRDRWLRQHFGEDGRKRWLENMRKSKQYRAFRDKTYCIWVDKKSEDFIREKLGGFVRRTADGRAEGFVFLPLSDYTGRFGHTVPWGHNLDKYIETHADEIGSFYQYRSGSRPHHGEPRAIDWLASGFWDPVRRADDGVLVDPMGAVLLEELKLGIFNNNGRWQPFAIPEGMIKRAYDEVKAFDKATGHRSPIGLRGIG